MRELLRAGTDLELARIDTRATPGFDGDKAAGKKALARASRELADRQELLYANGKHGDPRRILLVLQAMDTAGKGGILRHVVGAVDPLGVRIAAFKAPTDEEAEHDFLWRIRRELPDVGELGVFDRSHYEDVLIHRVRGFSTPETIEERYDLINAFEAELAESGVRVLKVMLHISAEEQKMRLRKRLERPDKHWKYSTGDLEERALWPAYMEAYELAIRRTTTDVAPWHVVPADRKWYSRLAVQDILLGALRDLDQQWPRADFDVEAELARLAAT